MFRIRREFEDDLSEMMSTDTLIGALGFGHKKVPEGYDEVGSYPLQPPFSYCIIARNRQTSEHIYILDELSMDMSEREAYTELLSLLEKELEAPREGQTLLEAFKEQTPKIIEEKKKTVVGLTEIGVKKVLYYLQRDIAGFGKINSMMFDPKIEDISCTGFRKPIFLWHRDYENIRTTVQFEEEDLNDFVMKLVHKAGKHVSLAYPIVDATLPGKHRYAQPGVFG